MLFEMKLISRFDLQKGHLNQMEYYVLKGTPVQALIQTKLYAVRCLDPIVLLVNPAQKEFYAL
jgi:hypothetical protein